MTDPKNYNTWSWSRPELSGCITCGSSKREHYGRGLCTLCASRERQERDRQRMKNDPEFREHKRKLSREAAKKRRKDNIEVLIKEREQCKKWYDNNKEYRKKYYKEYYNSKPMFHRIRAAELRFGGNYINVLERDNYQCVLCKKDLELGRKLNIHHLDKNTKNNSIENLVTTCSMCHQTVFHKDNHFKNKKTPITRG